MKGIDKYGVPMLSINQSDSYNKMCERSFTLPPTFRPIAMFHLTRPPAAEVECQRSICRALVQDGS